MYIIYTHKSARNFGRMVCVFCRTIHKWSPFLGPPIKIAPRCYTWFVIPGQPRYASAESRSILLTSGEVLGSSRESQLMAAGKRDGNGRGPPGDVCLRNNLIIISGINHCKSRCKTHLLFWGPMLFREAYFSGWANFYYDSAILLWRPVRFIMCQLSF